MPVVTPDELEPFLVADLFCGAGGSSQGCARAARLIGRKLALVCVNHDKTAIATHRKNHPTARHFIEDLNGADPERLVPEGRLDLLMASPECRWYSRAHGGKPINDQMRMSAYAIQRWMTALNVLTVLVENVPEFVNWGPLCTLEDKHKGDHIHDPLLKPKKACNLADKREGVKGQYFQAWIQNLWALGYDVDWRVLNAADFGDATSRERFFLIARKDGKPIAWPEPTHAKPGTDGGMFGLRKPWRAALEILDLDDHGRSLLDDPKYKKRPLSEPTRLRIAGGLMSFAGALAPRYIDLLGVHPSKVVVPPGRGKKTKPIQPFMLSQQGGGTPRPISEPVSTVTGDGYITVTTPFLIGQHTNNTPKSAAQDPVPVIPTVARIRLIEPMLAPYFGKSTTCKSAMEPVPSPTTKDRYALVSPLTIPYGPKANARSSGQPLHAIMTRDRLAVAFPTADPFIVPKFGERPTQAPRVRSAHEPLPAITGDATSCDCEDFKRNGLRNGRIGEAGYHGDCKHMRAVQLHDELARAQQPQPKGRPVLDMIREEDGSIRWERHQHTSGEAFYLPRRARPPMTDDEAAKIFGRL